MSPSTNCLQALNAYGERFGDKQENVSGYLNNNAFPWSSKQGTDEKGQTAGDALIAALEKDLGICQVGMPNTIGVAKNGQNGTDRDDEEGFVCRKCNLPLGEMGVMGMHTECRAQSQVKNLKEEEEKRIAKQKDLQSKNRKEYGIGWDISQVPKNAAAAGKLAIRDVPDGMVCLVVDEEKRTVRIASTTEPAASVNLEYLSTALEVRRREGHEVYFSLDPAGPGKESMQTKSFVPEWLAGTHVGDVLFQADYHLKELSMGEHEQPIIGMKSCFDLAEMDGGASRWFARQWFVVRKAEVQICDSDVLLPFVKMGVEAREQVADGDLMVDKAMTRPDHPMVKYAEAFTRNFDLIAERKSVIYYLRELAKASVLSKYLIDSETQLDEIWFHLSPEKKQLPSLEVPQLWHERHNAVLSLDQAPACMSVDSGDKKAFHGVYGGVQFGLEKFNLAGSRASGLQGSRTGALSLAASQKSPLTGGVAPVTSLKTFATDRFISANRLPSSLGASWQTLPRLATVPPPMKGMMPTLQAALAVAPPTRAPARLPASAAADEDKLQGVDLRLDNFDLSTAQRVFPEAKCASWGAVVKPIEECMNLGDVFWASLDNGNTFKDTDQALLTSIFNPFLSDRREEGERFSPPDASYSHVERLRNLVKDEENVTALRKKEFCKKEFDVENFNSIFPSSWSSKFLVADKKGKKASKGTRAYTERPEYKEHAEAKLQSMLKTASPEFDKKAEDGSRYRIYRLGNLEVRTVQALQATESVEAVFAICDDSKSTCTIDQQEKIIKATEYVEQRLVAGESSGFCYYLILDTEKGNKIMTERLPTGRVTWEENPSNLLARNTAARMTCQKECNKGAIVRDIYKRSVNATQDAPSSSPVCKLWARSTYLRLTSKQKKEEDPVLVAKNRQ